MVRPMIIVVANSKGGVGKSTIAVHLAAWLSEQGHSVTLADCDTQHSSSQWIHEAVPDLKTVQLADPNEILDRLPTLGQQAEYVVARLRNDLFYLISTPRAERWNLDELSRLLPKDGSVQLRGAETRDRETAHCRPPRRPSDKA